MSPTIPRTSQNPPAAVVIATSHVVRGGIGGRAAVFALERLGHRVWSLPTIILPFHPGHGPSGRSVPDASDFEQIVDDLAASSWLSEIGAVISGYFATPEQVVSFARFVDELKQRNPNIIYVCDPVMGDAGRLYVNAALADAIRDALLPRADFATPNRFELEWLTGTDCASNNDLVHAARQLPAERVVVTSADAMLRGHIGALYVDAKTALLGEHQAVPNPPHGPGDLTSALVAAHGLRGLAPKDLLVRTFGSVGQLVMQSVRAGSDELDLAAGQQAIISPHVPIQVRQLSVTAVR